MANDLHDIKLNIFFKIITFLRCSLKAIYKLLVSLVVFSSLSHNIQFNSKFKLNRGKCLNLEKCVSVLTKNTINHSLYFVFSSIYIQS